MMDCQSWTIARWSNCIDRYYIIASPRFNNASFVIDIQEIIKKENIDHFIPTCEEAIFVAAHCDEFNCKVWTSDKDLVIGLHNKFLFSQNYRNILPIPKTVMLKDFSDWENSEQYVFKPIYSRFASFVVINKKISKDFFEEEDQDQWIAQKLVRGKEICVYSIWSEGKMKAYSAYHPLFRAGKGSGVFFEPVQNKEIFELVNNFGQDLHYMGQMCFDVILDEQARPFFIECNPRGTSGAHLINVQLANAFLGNELIVNNDTKDFSIKYAMAMLHPFSFFKKRVRQSQDIIFKWHDSKPFFLQILSLIEISSIKIWRRCTWLEATTADIEWNGHES